MAGSTATTTAMSTGIILRSGTVITGNARTGTAVAPGTATVAAITTAGGGGGGEGGERSGGSGGGGASSGSGDGADGGGARGTSFGGGTPAPFPLEPSTTRRSTMLLRMKSRNTNWQQRK